MFNKHHYLFMSLVCYTLRKHYIILYITTFCMFGIIPVPSVPLKYYFKGQLKLPEWSLKSTYVAYITF